MATSGSGIQIQIQPRNGISTVSSSTSLPTTSSTLNNGLTSSPVIPASNTSPIASRSQPNQMSQPEQIIVPVGNVLNSSKSHSESSSSSSRAQSSSQNSVSPSPGSSDSKTVLDRTRLRELVKEVDPLEQMDDDVEDVLLQVADDFIENVVTASCQLAKHRKSNTLETKDVQLYLEKCWNMQIAGFGSDEIKPFKKSMATEAHKQRLALIRKTLKKC